MPPVPLESPSLVSFSRCLTVFSRWLQVGLGEYACVLKKALKINNNMLVFSQRAFKRHNNMQLLCQKGFMRTTCYFKGAFKTHENTRVFFPKGVQNTWESRKKALNEDNWESFKISLAHLLKKQRPSFYAWWRWVVGGWLREVVVGWVDETSWNESLPRRNRRGAGRGGMKL